MAGSFHRRYRSKTLLPSAARTTTQTTADQRNDGSSLRIRTKVTAVSGSFSIVPKVQRKNPDGTYTDVLLDAAITTVSESVLEVGPGLATTANASANALIGGPYRVIVTHGTADSGTYSVTAETF
jgi:hypothetical protein